uniref:Protein kinase domain-containing protein n=1 Tax=Meloidogyne hapla TaxID=6305 RepID=A0A1I8BQV3_MELHA
MEIVMELAEMDLKEYIQKMQNKLKENDASEYYGTFQFMSPELATNGLQSKYATKSDIWALGIIIFQMLFGFDQYPYKVMDDMFQQIFYFSGSDDQSFIDQENDQNYLFDKIYWDGKLDYSNFQEKIKIYSKHNKMLTDFLMNIIEVID